MVAVWVADPLLAWLPCTWVSNDCRSAANCCSGVLALAVPVVAAAVVDAELVPEPVVEPACVVLAPALPPWAWSSKAWISEARLWNRLVLPLAVVLVPDWLGLVHDAAALACVVPVASDDDAVLALPTPGGG